MSKFFSSLRSIVKTYTGSQAPSPTSSSNAFSFTAHRLLKSEPQSRYEPGGYHRVSVGELYNKRYEVVRQLGWGQYSTVWLVKDLRDNKLAAMKVMVADITRSETKGDWDELDRLTTLEVTNPRAPGFGHVCQLLDSFTHEGPNGNHICLIIEAISFSLSDVFRSSGGKVPLPLPLIKRVCSHTLLALQYLHEECGIVHTDIKDDNILVGGMPLASDNEEPAVVTEADLMSATFKLSDFGAANTMRNRFAQMIQPESLRAPEVIVGAEWDTKADIWNLGCLIYEFARGTKLFDPHWDNAQSGMSPSQTHLAQISGLCGDFPSAMLSEGSRTQQYFDEQGALRQGAGRYHITLRDLLMRAGHSLQDVEEISKFLLKMLVIDPTQRWTATQLLGHPWLRTTR
ncbi:hypothetical protein D9619_001150 [Psilocybe cf. subviscida]|uniref:non-specific serine/threonine protein kinase n=1 Tax=Psilocybe cf. subviscida TaxID=2480587 RepID=A0A8H5F2K4_9AGAR|nr:hypothetical protein D9619_001150 [Psilocybe cf. subviscida]